MSMLLRNHFLWLAVPILLLLGLLVWFHNPVSAQSTVFQDTFDAESQGLNKTTLTNWTVTGKVDVIGTGFFPFYPGNGNYLDMDGSPGNGTITPAPLTLSPGCYQLSFEMGQNGGPTNDNGLAVTLGTVFTGAFAAPVPGTGVLTPITAQITVPGDDDDPPTVASLVFSETGTVDARGSVLDDVLLVFVDDDACGDDDDDDDEDEDED